VLERPGFHYVSKRASWLNMVEIAIGVLCGQCLNCRIGATVSDPKSSPGSDSECRTHPASNRYSQSTGLAQKWAAPIPANPISGAPNLKSHYHCPGVVGVTLMMLQWLEDIAAVLIGCGACDFPSRVDRLLPSSISLSAAT